MDPVRSWFFANRSAAHLDFNNHRARVGYFETSIQLFADASTI
ncbi:MAG TPA: hypothetical protein PLA43_21295 [Bryobacteraceae bacterium]|nr:hypothetical protein [Bryobacteraceae bacterium]HPU74496.1 hypothetical protein [Bryobacteraceae bacterium]